MALQIGSALREAGHRLLSRTGAILLGTFLVLLLGIQTLLNTLLAEFYTRIGLGEVVSQLPLVLDLPLSVVGGGIAVGMLLSMYHSIVSFRTFVAGTRRRFPDDALTRNVPLAMVNVFVGGIVYGLIVFLGSLLLLVPGIFAYVAFIFMVPYVVVEDRNFVDALKASYRLTAGDRLMLFFLLVLVGVAAGLVGGVAGFLGSLLFAQPTAQIVTVVVQTPVSLYTTAVVAVAFQQLREAADDEPPTVPDETGTPSTAV